MTSENVLELRCVNELACSRAGQLVTVQTVRDRGADGRHWPASDDDVVCAGCGEELSDD